MTFEVSGGAKCHEGQMQQDWSAGGEGAISDKVTEGLRVHV